MTPDTLRRVGSEFPDGQKQYNIFFSILTLRKVRIRDTFIAHEIIIRDTKEVLTPNISLDGSFSFLQISITPDLHISPVKRRNLFVYTMETEVFLSI